MSRLVHSSILLVIISLLLPTLSVEARIDRFNPDGTFWILGKAPKDFEDFGGFNLNTNHDRRLPGARVELTDGTHLRFKTLNVSRSNLTFTTATVRGLSYSFTGKFLQGGNFAARDLQETAVLEGTLRKMRSGKVVADARLKFTYFGGT